MPKAILLFSGKRKSGKDFLTDHLQNVLLDKCEIIKISQPIKHHWAKEKNLNLDELLSDSKYKEQYRLDMVRWSDEIRAKDYGYFCRSACHNVAEKPIWIVSDIRRKTDIKWFRENYGNLLKIIRITADKETRMDRGFIFQQGVDDVMSECDLDDFMEWDIVINNDKDGQSLEDQTNSVLALITHVL